MKKTKRKETQIYLTREVLSELIGYSANLSLEKENVIIKIPFKKTGHEVYDNLTAIQKKYEKAF